MIIDDKVGLCSIGGCRFLATRMANAVASMRWIKKVTAADVIPQPLFRAGFSPPGFFYVGSFGQATVFFAITLTGQRRFQTALFSGRNIEGMPFNFANNVFLLHFPFEPAERAF
jgi:hypothetical protein